MSMNAGNFAGRPLCANKLPGLDCLANTVRLLCKVCGKPIVAVAHIHHDVIAPTVIAGRATLPYMCCNDGAVGRRIGKVVSMYGINAAMVSTI